MSLTWLVDTSRSCRVWMKSHPRNDLGLVSSVETTAEFAAAPPRRRHPGLRVDRSPPEDDQQLRIGYQFVARHRTTSTCRYGVMGMAVSTPTAPGSEGR